MLHERRRQHRFQLTEQAVAYFGNGMAAEIVNASQSGALLLGGPVPKVGDRITMSFDLPWVAPPAVAATVVRANPSDGQWAVRYDNQGAELACSLLLAHLFESAASPETIVTMRPPESSLVSLELDLMTSGHNVLFAATALDVFMHLLQNSEAQIVLIDAAILGHDLDALCRTLEEEFPRVRAIVTDLDNSAPVVTGSMGLFFEDEDCCAACAGEWELTHTHGAFLCAGCSERMIRDQMDRKPPAWSEA